MQAVINEQHSVETEQEAKSFPNRLLSSERVAGQTGVGVALFAAFSGFRLSHRKEIRFCSGEAWVNLKSQYQHLDYWYHIV